MAVRFHLGSSRPLELLRFAWSPMFESVLSMKPLVQPKREPAHLPWVRRCRDLPSDLRAEVRLLTGTFQHFTPGVFEVGMLGDSPDFADELAAFREIDLDLFVHEVSLALGGLGCGHDLELERTVVHDPEYRRLVVEAAPDEDTAELARQLFADPTAVRERYAALLARYWEEAFAEEWSRLLPRIEAEVADAARTLVTRGAAGLVEELLPEATWHADEHAIEIERPWDESVDVARRGGLHIVPTMYGWPRVLIALVEPWALAIVAPLRDLRRPEVPLAADHEVADGLRALGDETRLQIARLVAEQPRSTKELAELLKASDSAVNRHLKILDGAGIVTGERDGYFVLYRLRPERIGQLGGALRHTLGLATRGPTPALPVAVARPR